MNAAEQEEMMLRVDKKGEKLDDVVKEWVDKHETVWKPWLEAVKA
jgi:glycine betaine/proline transport system substrate-binding protein